MLNQAKKFIDVYGVENQDFCQDFNALINVPFKYGDATIIIFNFSFLLENSAFKIQASNMDKLLTILEKMINKIESNNILLVYQNPKNLDKIEITHDNWQKLKELMSRYGFKSCIEPPNILQYENKQQSRWFSTYCDILIPKK